MVCGPTGIGKTSFSIALSQKFNGEIIGADSMQIYKHMDIGTAKPDEEERKAAPHHLIDFVDPKDEFDAGEFVKHAVKAVERIIGRKRLPIVAGGTGLYIRALLHGLFRSSKICSKTMEELTRLLDEKGSRHLHDTLAECDPKAAQKIHPNDSFRVLRALEVFRTTGKKISDRQADHNFQQNRYLYLKLGLWMSRDKLYERIDTRVDIMLDMGLLDEVARLMEKGYSPDLKPMQSIGYKHMGLFIDKKVSWDEAVRLFKRDTRRYAKRQFTWFNRDKEINWVTPDETEKAFRLVKEFLT